MTYNDYASIPAANWTKLNKLRTGSPLHYKDALTNPGTDSTGRMLGRAVHAMMFEPESFWATHVVTDIKRRGTKEWTALEAANPGKTILKRDENEEALAQVDALRSCPLVADYLDGAVFEQTVTWTDPATGIPCKARLDWVNPRTRTLIDLKGTPTTHPMMFGKRAAKDGYHIQLGGHYYNACRYGLGWEPEESAIVAVEFNRPFDVAVFTLEEDDVALAQTEIDTLLAKLAECERRGAYPGHGTDEHDAWTASKRRINLPRWAWGDGGDDTDADELEEIGFKPADND